MHRRTTLGWLAVLLSSTTLLACTVAPTTEIISPADGAGRAIGTGVAPDDAGSVAPTADHLSLDGTDVLGALAGAARHVDPWRIECLALDGLDLVAVLADDAPAVCGTTGTPP
jgi:hypothetical protein